MAPATRLVAGITLSLCAALGAGCDDDPPAESTDMGGDMAPTGAVTWHQDVAPIVMRRCATCHVVGGVAPFPLDSYETVSRMGAVALNAIEAGRMPPWMPDPDCREYEDQRLLTADEKALFRAWVDGGTPEGDAARAAPIEIPEAETFEATDVARPMQSFVPDDGVADDYRCFILDTEFDAPTFLTASRAVPDAEAIVHHVLVYALAPDQVPGALAADAESEAEGYPCFGSPMPERTGDVVGFGGGGLPSQVGSWVPGANDNILPPDHAIPIMPGSRLVMQVHYNFGASGAEPDATTFEMRLTDEPPLFEALQRPVLVRHLEIPAGEPEAVNRARFVHYGDAPLTITSAGPHMHTLGVRLKSTVERADGSEECLLDVKRWLYEWQQGFEFLPDEWVTLNPGDAITLECVFDNSAANQPFVDGAQIEPRDVAWGEGTLDEMCMNYITFSRPYTPPAPPAEGCTEDVAGCIADCADDRSTADCLMACGGGPQCTFCAFQQTPDCGGVRCAADLLALRDDPCLQHCYITVTMLGGEPTACLKDACPEAYAAAMGCLGEVLDEGTCDQPIVDACGLRLPR